MAKAFSIEDGNISTRPITSSKKQTYRDIDCAFSAKPSGDIYKKSDAAAIKQAIKTLLLTSKGEVPFNPYFGADLNSLLFGLSSRFDSSMVEDRIYNAISNYEPRAVVREVDVNVDGDNNTASVFVEFRIADTTEIVTTNVSIARIR